MTESYQKLAQGILSTSSTALYTVPGSTETIIKHIILVNYSASNRTAALHQDDTTDANYILPDVTIEAGGWADFSGVICMTSGIVYGKASAGSSITYTIYGVEIS